MLNAKQQRFVQEYLIDLNASAAYKRAGYTATGNSAETNAVRLLRKDQVAREVKQALAKAQESGGLSLEKTLREVRRLAYSDPRKFYNADGSLRAIMDLDDDTAACVASIEIDEIVAGETVIGTTKKLKQWDKNAALEKAMKYHGAYEKDNSQRMVVTIKDLTGRG